MASRKGINISGYYGVSINSSRSCQLRIDYFIEDE